MRFRTEFLDFSFNDVFPNFWFVALAFLRQRWLFIIGAWAVCFIANSFIASFSAMTVAGGFAALLVITFFVLLISYRQLQLISRKIKPDSGYEVIVRKTPVFVGKGLFGEVGWLVLTNRAFYFLPVRLFVPAKQRRWHLQDIESYTPGKDFSLPGGDAAMWVKVKHPSGTLRWLLPNANRWYVTFTIQLKRDKQNNKRKHGSSGQITRITRIKPAIMPTAKKSPMPPKTPKSS